MKFVFRNFESSDIARAVVTERMEGVFARFEDFRKEQVLMTLTMDNSPQQAGPDRFEISLHCQSGRYRGLRLTRRASHLYAAVAELVDRLPDILNRHGDKKRVSRLHRVRKMMDQKRFEPLALEGKASKEEWDEFEDWQESNEPQWSQRIV